jgi:type VI protein secretion system component VasK
MAAANAVSRQQQQQGQQGQGLAEEADDSFDQAKKVRDLGFGGGKREREERFGAL